MKSLPARFWERVQTSYWFVPMLMTLAAIALAVAALVADATWGRQVGEPWFTYNGSAEGARQLTSTVAGALITAAGMIFSVMIVVLSLASQQFGPRMLRNFLRDRGNQVAIGTFIASFIYNMAVLTHIKEYQNGPHWVPRLSITLGLLLAIFSFLMLIYFIHHMAVEVRADQIIASVGSELDEEIESTYPDSRDSAPAAPQPQLPLAFSQEAAQIRSKGTGYVETIAADDMLKLTEQHELVVQLLCRPGSHLIDGEVAALAWPPQKVDDEIRRKLVGCISLLDHRTPTQDVEFPILQLVEIAVRALSPSMSDPFTACNAVDRLAGSLCKLVERHFPPCEQCGKDKKLRLIMHNSSCVDLIDASFMQVRQAAADDVAVSMRLLEALKRVAQRARRQDDRVALARHAGMVRRTILRGTREQWDIDGIEKRYREAMTAIGLEPDKLH